MSNIKNWSTTPGSNNSASPNGAPEGMAPSAVNDIMRQQMADHRTQWQDAEWFDWGHVPTRTGNTTFTVPTDLTAVYNISGRRLKCSDASTIYATILSASYTAVTTITVLPDSGNLSASLTAVAVAILSNKNSLPLSVLPAGIGPLPYAGSTIPSGWLECDGSAVSRTTYAALFTAIGTTWGVGNGTTTFNLPDIRGRAAIGAGTGSSLTARVLAATGGEETHILTTPEMPAHTHTAGSTLNFGQSGSGTTFRANDTVGNASGSTGGGGAHNNMQPYVVTKMIISY